MSLSTPASAPRPCLSPCDALLPKLLLPRQHDLVVACAVSLDWWTVRYLLHPAFRDDSTNVGQTCCNRTRMIRSARIKILVSATLVSYAGNHSTGKCSTHYRS